MKKKVLFVATVLRGHMLAFHLPFMRWFQQQGYEVHCCAGNDTESNPPQIPYCDRYIEIAFRRNPLNPANVQAYRKLKSLVDSEDYALIHCHTPVGGMLGRLAARQARKNGTRVCYTAHGFHFFSGAPLKNWLLYYPAELLLSRLTDLLITINQEDYARALHFRAKQAVLVHGVGVDLEKYDIAVDTAAVRKEIGIGEDTPMIITVGEHTRRKNHEACIRATEKLDGAALVLCGVGVQEDALQALAEELHIADRVRFLGFRDDIPALLITADAFIFPSLHEGLPVALMEAMAAGLPCVVSDVRGNTDLIQDGIGGYVYLAEDAGGMADGLKTLMENCKLRRQFGERNQNEVRQYGLANVLEKMTALYEEQLSMRGDA